MGYLAPFALLSFFAKPLAQELTYKTFMTKNIIFIITVLISGHTIAQQPSPVKVEGGLVQGKTEDGLTVIR